MIRIKEAAPAKRVTKPKRRVTKVTGGARVAPKILSAQDSPAIPPANVGGRPKVHASSADRQRAYRERKKGKA